MQSLATCVVCFNMGRFESVTEHLFTLITTVSMLEISINVLETCLCDRPLDSRTTILYVKIVKIGAVFRILSLPKSLSKLESIVSASALHARCDSF
jgi:hypothetical protein